jgi:hypothetical protein
VTELKKEEKNAWKIIRPRSFFNPPAAEARFRKGFH